MNYHNITTDDMLNGSGLRVVLWTSGCEHRCNGCHNPQTWDRDSGIKFDSNAWNEVLALLEKPYISGITYSGGDPLFPANRSIITSMAKTIHQLYPDKTQWLYTGYNYEDIKDLEIMKYIDVLVDGEYIDSLRDTSLPFRGSSNQRLIDVQKSLKENKIIKYID